MQSHWKESYPQITELGIHDTKDTSTAYGADPVILEVGDIRIAVLNYTYGTNGIALPADMPFGVDLLKEAQVEADIPQGRGNSGLYYCMSSLGDRIPSGAGCFPGKMDKAFPGKWRRFSAGHPSSCDRAGGVGEG